MVTDNPTPSRRFVHLHVHSQYSLLDGACRVADAIARVKELGQSSIAITDHGCLFGLIEFYTKAVEAGIKPILGIEAYMAPQSRTDRTSTGSKDGGYHLLLLAKDRVGYQNLLKLSSIAYTEGFYYKPRIDKEVLRAHSQGLFATSACLGGEIPDALTREDRKRAKAIAEQYIDIFGPERFFIELQRHIPEQDAVNPHLIDLADQMGLGLVATNDAHFLRPEDHAPHEVLCCISTGKLLTDESRLKYPTQLYLKSTDEMYAAMDHAKWREACENSARIADQCEVQLEFGVSRAPVVRIEKLQPAQGKPKSAGKSDGGKDAGKAAGRQPAPVVKGSTEWFKDFCANYQLLPFDATKDSNLSQADLKQACDQALRELCAAGLIWRYGEQGITPEIQARLDRELNVLCDKNISAYFLIVWDFVNEARRRGIPANARGSGVGTMVGYVLGLSNACPVTYSLLFERFTDPDRSEYPDIDIDICQDGRQEIIDYVRKKYGHVAQIITFGTLKARAAIRDVSRVMNLPLGEVDQLCKLVGDGLGVTLEKALQQEPDLRKLYDENPAIRKVLDTAQELEGMARHAGVHAAGVVVATQPLDTIIPLYQPPGTDQLVTQWDGPTVEKVGLLKMDFLGLRTLSIIERAKLLVRQSLDAKTIAATVAPKADAGTQSAASGQAASQPVHDPLDLDRLRFDDQRVLDLFRRGETSSVFQFESDGMRDTLLAMRPDRLEDLIAANALYRPGPMDLIGDYCARKHRKQPVPRVHEIVDRLTAETYGIMVYQEQVMQVVNQLGDIPLRAAYSLIKAISKKKQKDIDKVRPKFVEGSQKKGLTAQQAEDLFELIMKFAGYGFNKSHSTGYAIVAYQTAYLKTYFPIQYMAAVLTYESQTTEKVVEYIDECRKVLLPDGRRGVQVRPPDINLSEVAFTVVYDKGEARDASHGHIRFGLSAIKGVGEKAILAILEARGKGGPFTSIYDLCERVSLQAMNRATLEALVKCGALDSLHGREKRAAVLAAVEGAMSAGQRAARERDSGQMNFFAAAAADSASADAGKALPVQVTLPSVEPWPSAELLKHEKSVLGFYVSSHPLQEHAGLLERYTSASLEDIHKLAAEVEVVVAGLLTRVRTTLTKNGRNPGQKMAMISLEDLTGSLEGVVFSDTYAIAAPLLEPDRIVFLRGKIDRKRQEPNLIVSEVIPLEQAIPRLTQSVRIILREHRAHAQGPLNGELASLKTLLRQNASGAAIPGEKIASLQIEVRQNRQRVLLQVKGGGVRVSNDLPQRIAAVLRDEHCCELSGPEKLVRSGATGIMHTGEDTQPKMRLASHAEDEEFCASIDRY